MKKILLVLTMMFFFVGMIACSDLDNTTIDLSTELETTIETTTEVPSTELPPAFEPTTELPTIEEPTTEVPTTMEPTTEVPTTEVPTTEVPTTLEPTTEEPTTDLPTTLEPTTEEVTTVMTNPIVEINLFSMNDFHGGAYTSMEMISRVGAYLKAFEGHKLQLTNGDILQGTAISNYYHGEVLIDVLNNAGFDGFVIGNHEFDWGIDVIGNYQDGDETNGELNHPVLAANIVYEDSGLPLEFTIPYIIEEFDGVQVGVIGLIGSLMNSIAASRTENIIFLDPVDTAAYYAKELREDYGVDIVVVYIHDSSNNNDEYAALTGLERIDAMFNGHAHQNEAESISRPGLAMPHAQMNNYNTSLVQIKLVFDKDLGIVTSYEVNGINNTQLPASDNEIDLIIEEYATDSVYLNFINEVLTVSNDFYGRYDMAQWGASVIRDYAGVDIGATNAGGFRVSMDAGNLTMGELITIYPFDNIIKTSEMTGQQITDFYLEVINYGSDVVFDDGLTYNNQTNVLEINGEPIILDRYYTVGAVDYIFDKTDYDFIQGVNITQTIHFMRDLLAEDLKNATEGFNPYDGSHFVE